MNFVCLHNKQEIERFLQKNSYLHIYSLGDLDEFFWPYTVWYGLKTNGRIEAVALLYVGQLLPTLLALSDEDDVIRELLGAIEHLLPHRFYAHLSPGVENVLNGANNLEPHGQHYKMALDNQEVINSYNCADVVRLSQLDLDDIQEFYKESYPGNWFDPRMLETNQYFGIRDDAVLVAIAGIHVYSPQYKVAALGNIATLPLYRRKGYGQRVTAKLCRSLSTEVSSIGLNVKADNKAAILCYQKLGFKIVAAYGEFMVQRKGGAY